MQKWAYPGLFFIFGLFKQTIHFLQQINVKKCPSSIWRWDSNPWPLEHESLPITTRPVLISYSRVLNQEPQRIICRSFLNGHKVSVWPDGHIILPIWKKKIRPKANKFVNFGLKLCSKQPSRNSRSFLKFCQRAKSGHIVFIPGLFFFTFVFLYSRHYKVGRLLDANHGPLVSEANAEPTEPQPLPS